MKGKFTLPTKEQCKWSNSGRVIYCEYGLSYWGSDKSGTKESKEDIVYTCVISELTRWASFFGLEVVNQEK
jgi:hypothetical protein